MVTKMNVGVKDGMKRKGLLCIFGLDAIGVAFVYPVDGFIGLPEKPQSRGRSIPKDIEVVVSALLSQNGNLSGLTRYVHFPNHLSLDIF